MSTSDLNWFTELLGSMAKDSRKQTHLVNFLATFLTCHFVILKFDVADFLIYHDEFCFQFQNASFHFLFCRL